MEKAAPNKGQTTVVEPTRAQRAIARRAAESRATVPHLELCAEVELDSPLAEPTAWLVKACALALREVPRANGAYRDGRFELYSRVNIGIAVRTEDEFALATVFDADAKSVRELAEEIAGLSGRALTPPEQSGATFTLWEYGVASASGVIVPPQAAAMTAGAVRRVPLVRNGAIVSGHGMTITLACDHRILYGHHATAVLSAVGAHLQAASR